ncbi:MAG: TIGR00725 family protein [Solirubrobacteraceae bacterium]
MIGASQAQAQELADAEAVGRELARAGAVVVSGGRGGVMAAVSKGASEAGGIVVGLLPGVDREGANQWLTVALPTGLGALRNGLVVRSAHAVIAVGGAYGTLSEIALALHAGLPVLGLRTWDIPGVEPVPDAGAAVVRALALAQPGAASDAARQAGL